MRTRILWILAGLITYGSLYPFHFTLPGAHAAAWEKLLFDWSPFTSRGDVLGNIALFVPFGFASVFSVPGESRPPLRVISVMAASFALALLLQVAQIYFPPRTPAMADLMWNMAGTALGIMGGRSLGGQFRLRPHALPPAHALPLGMIVLWVAAELLPFVPSLDLQAIKNSAKALLHPTFALEQVLFHASGAMIVGWALTAIAGETQARRWLPVILCAVAAAKPLIVTRALDVSTLLGLALGCAGWWLLSRWPRWRRDTALLTLLLAAYALGALLPFAIRDAPQSFSLLPFAALLRGSMLANSIALAANLFLYGAILGVIRMSGSSPVPSSIMLAVLVAVFEAIQAYLVGRTPDVTEPLLVLLAGQALRYVPVRAARAGPAPAATRPLRRPAVAATPADPGIKVAGWLARVGIACFAMALFFAVVLRLPRIPYNVRELFLGGGSFPFLMIFALALLWIGAGALLVGRCVATSARPYIALPLLSFGAGVVGLLLLYASVTGESLDDIAGSNNLHWFVINENIWGDWARRAFLLLPSSGVVSFFERPVRYAALYGPLVTFLALMFAGIAMRKRDRIDARQVLPLVVSAGLWLWLCKAIAFDWSSTDNLNELIARDGPWGWGGGGYLYALLGVICANAVLLASMPLTLTRTALAGAATLAMVPVGWWLLNAGLEQRVEKYGSVFSGVQFLLGPDRKHLLGQDVLFLRWSAVQLAGVLVIAAGARLAQPAIAWRAQRSARSAGPHRP